jgi:hypothetical protein
LGVHRIVIIANFFQAFDLEGKANASLNSPSVANLAPAGTMLKRTGTFVNLVQKAINTQSESMHVCAQHKADMADNATEQDLSAQNPRSMNLLHTTRRMTSLSNVMLHHSSIVPYACS